MKNKKVGLGAKRDIRARKISKSCHILQEIRPADHFKWK